MGSYFSRPIALVVPAIGFLLFCSSSTFGNRRRAPAGGPVAIVVDERLAVLRRAPDLSAKLLRRVSRGQFVAITGAKKGRDGVKFYRVNVTSRTSGWLQSEALVFSSRVGDDQRLWRLIQASEGFDRIARARIFLDAFSHSRFRPAVLLLFGAGAEEAAARLSGEAARRLNEKEMAAGGAPVSSYFLNYNGLDRYSRQGIRFVFDRPSKRFHYDGASWREIIRHHPHSPEAAEAKKRLEAANKFTTETWRSQR